MQQAALPHVAALTQLQHISGILLEWRTYTRYQLCAARTPSRHGCDNCAGEDRFMVVKIARVKTVFIESGGVAARRETAWNAATVLSSTSGAMQLRPPQQLMALALV
jgi:hypothetical protein